MRSLLLASVAAAALTLTGAGAFAQDQSGGAAGASEHGGGQAATPSGGGMSHHGASKEHGSRGGGMASDETRSGRHGGMEHSGSMTGSNEAMHGHNAMHHNAKANSEREGANSEREGANATSHREGRGSEHANSERGNMSSEHANSERRGEGSEHEGAAANYREGGHRGETGSRGSAVAHARLAPEQRTRFVDTIRRDRVATTEHVDFDVNVGVVIPRHYHFYPLPEDIVSFVPEYRGYDFIVADNNILIIDPATREIVDVIPEG